MTPFMQLQPAGAPLPFPAPCAAFTEPLLEPVVVDGLGVLAVGGPAGVGVFEVFERQRLWCWIPARRRITGFAAGEGAIYVQDGPVLARWSLTSDPPQCVSAVDLRTGASKVAAGGGVLAAADLDALFLEDTAEQHARQSVEAAHTTVAWARLLVQVSTMQQTWQEGGAGPAAVQPSSLGELAGLVRGLLDTGVDADPGAVLAGALTALTDARRVAPGVEFSRPVVRRHQIDGSIVGAVFGLGADGTVRALDDTLQHSVVRRYDPPGALRLCLLERPSSVRDGTFECRLFYATATGEILELDDGLAPEGSWPAGTTSADGLLQITDGRLWRSGTRGGLLIGPPDAGSVPTVTVTPNDGTPLTVLTVDPGTQLCLAGDGSNVRLIAYGDGAVLRDRWGATRAPGWVAFLPDPAPPAPPAPSVLLVVHADASAGPSGGNVGFRVLLATDVDRPDPALASDFPPSAIELATGTFDPGEQSGALPRIGWIRSAPLVHGATASLVVQAASPFDAVVGFMTPDPSSGTRPFDAFVTRLKDGNGGELPAAAGTAVPLAAGADQLLQCSLPALREAVLPAAHAELDHLVRWSGGALVQVTITFAGSSAALADFQYGVCLPIQISDGPLRWVKTGRDHVFALDSALAGQTVSVDTDGGACVSPLDPKGRILLVDDGAWSISSNSPGLNLDSIADLQITIANGPIADS